MAETSTIQMQDRELFAAMAMQASRGYSTKGIGSAWRILSPRQAKKQPSKNKEAPQVTLRGSFRLMSKSPLQSGLLSRRFATISQH
jgi:hypothetical protein